MSLYVESFAAQFLALYPAKTQRPPVRSTTPTYTNTSRVSSWLLTNNWLESAASLIYTYYWDHAPPGQDQGLRHRRQDERALGHFFAKTGDPNKGGSYVSSDSLVNWPESPAARNVTQHMGDGWGDQRVADAAQVALFKELLPPF
ncbi:hypothetical protein BBJ28_00003330 [Nothophytophthora sp. Chile5]|nr:hypothetical protein BBJ28_00003330 [Nothophytophthora sp. Chile5]